MNKKLIGVVTILAMLLVSSMAAFASASPPIAKQNTQGALGVWTIDGVTIEAQFAIGTIKPEGTGAPVQVGKLYVKVVHPFGTTESTVTTFDYTLKTNRASVSALMPFTIYGNGFNHQITITWTAISQTIVDHSHTQNEIVNIPMKAAAATLTISTPEIPPLDGYHPETYSADFAVIYKFVGVAFANP